MIEGEVEVLEIDALPQERGDRFVARTGFDPRALATPYRWFRISPRRLQAWREVMNELPDRELMRDGRCWSDASAGAPRGRGPEASRAEAKENQTTARSCQIEPGDADGDREGGPA